ncbi:MAG: arylsulfatase [Pseudomonadales bacterium]
MKRNKMNGGPSALHFLFQDPDKRTALLLGLLLVLVLFLSACQQELTPTLEIVQPAPASISPSPSDKPNVLLIVVDDMGFSDLGYFGGEIPTPNIDGLAADSVALTNFHTAPTCSPTRSMLLSGVDSHVAGLGNMFEELAPNQKGKPGYEGYLHERVAPLPAVFQDAGYRTYMAGKWHLGLADDQAPTQRGFDHAFALLQGGAGHFSDMQSLWETEIGNRGKAKYREDGKMLDALPDNFEYSSQFYVDKMLDYLELKQESSSKQEQPFFAYLSFSAPHWPLQAPAAAIARHKGKYDEGYEALARKRLQRQIELGFVPKDTKLGPRPADAPAWNELSEEEQALSARRMEIYAAMLDEVDRHTGRLIDSLKASGQLDNTIVVFMSDNGAEGHSLDALFPEPVFPKAREWVLGTFKYDLASLGGPDSYVLYGPGWGWAATPAFRGYKAYVTQGGTRVPAFISYPALSLGGSKSNALLSVKDIAPTLLELAGIAKPGGVFRGRDVAKISGQSMLAVLANEGVDTPGLSEVKERVLGFELFGKRSIRQGSWSLVHMFKPQGIDDWQLYNLDQDLAEQNNLAESHPEKLKEMISLWEVYASENGVVLPDWNSGY